MWATADHFHPAAPPHPLELDFTFNGQRHVHHSLFTITSYLAKG